MEKQFKKYENILRNLDTVEMILRETKRVNVFKGRDAIDALKKEDLEDDEIKELMKYLLLENIIFKVEVKKKQSNACDVFLDYRFGEKDFYIWAKEKSSFTSLFIILAVIALGLCLVMFQMWPTKLRFLASYLSYALGAFIVFLLVLGVIRLIIISITIFTHPPGIWLFPNLFEDCGFIESFIPLWSYRGEDTSKEKTE
ncbi:Translocation protein SEC62 [Nosema granulosis]|uniref:Translocation protein SEC62 n=1 Tax=Nosema granulosis TaxID=83296 RepID=A0A9P6GYW5_9MICR|nr:Translocation protein SEC62 [Nosema granulosis]